MSFDYSRLRGRIREIFKTEEAFANALGIARPTLSAIFNSKANFSQESIAKAVELLNIEKEEVYFYFLKPES